MNNGLDEQNSIDTNQGYMLELEKIYNRYLCWDRDGVSYGYTLFFLDNIVGNNASLERSFNSKKTTGAENFKRAYTECISIMNPKALNIYEFNGTSRNAKPISVIPITIKIINQPLRVDRQSAQKELPKSDFSVKSLFSGLMGIGDDASGKDGSVFILDLMDNVRKKDEEILRLTNEINQLSFENRRIELEKETIIAKVKSEQHELQEELAEYEQDIEALEEEKQKLETALEQANEALDNIRIEKQKADGKNNMYQLGATALTQIVGKFAVGYARSNPSGFLGGLDENALASIESAFLGTEPPAEESPVRRRREVEEVVEETEQLSPEEAHRRESIKGIANWLQDNWPIEDLAHLVNIINYLTNQPMRMKVMLDAINRVLTTEAQNSIKNEESSNVGNE